MEDTRVVLDAVGSTTAHMVCHGGSGFLGMLFAATYPERTNTLTLMDGSARTLRADDYPIGLPPDVVDRYAERDARVWGTDARAAVWAPSRADDEAFRRWSGRFERGSSSPSMHEALLRWVVSLDLRAVLPTIRVPTLVMHHEAGRMIPLDHGASSPITFPTRSWWSCLAGITGFSPSEPTRSSITSRSSSLACRPLANPTARWRRSCSPTSSRRPSTRRVGDKRWTEILNQHDALVHRELDRHRGRKVNPTGDGLLATFDGPARAVRCAQAICEGVRAFGIEVRAGLHTGEVELRGDDIGGIAVHIGQRVSGLAAAGEVLVSRTVTDLVAGSGLQFEDRGERALKGVPGSWAVFALRS